MADPVAPTVNPYGQGGQMTPEQWLSQQQGQWQQGLSQKHNLNTKTLSSMGSQPYLLGLANAAGPASQQAGATLNYLLQQQGRIDPRMMNMMRSQIAGDTAQQSRQLQGRMARSGWGNSGLGMALQQSLRNAGSMRENDLIARQAAMQQQQMRQDLGLYQNMIGDPSMDLQSMLMGQAMKPKKGSMLGPLLTTAGTVVGGMYGGPAGAAAGNKIGSSLGNAIGGDDNIPY